MNRPSNRAILRNLANGTAKFEILEVEEHQNPAIPNLLTYLLRIPMDIDKAAGAVGSACFAKIGSWGTLARTGTSQAIKKVEHYTVRKVIGDGRCMFRALVQGMASNKGLHLHSGEETQEADQLRLAVMDALCRNDKRRRLYEEALIAITVEESLKRYCQRIPSSDFWGGESELLVLSRMCSQPIIVYIPESEAKGGAKWGSGFIPIAEYGSEFTKASKDRKARKPVRLLYNGSNHYDLLI
eukprot:TRINITY_DN6627_c0_g1_i3.p1 TRINITY_DN6627_c0_g1~~TRINITY_DN6627_c0_g1_i3.p1  ORF type:complete len:241 (+),score=33.67 TRINITY_DN6627_c0_g1_i3:112-834(+)